MILFLRDETAIKESGIDRDDLCYEIDVKLRDLIK